MAILSVRLPKDVEEKLPRRQRSAWVIDALRDKLKKDRGRQLGMAAARHSHAHLKEMAIWDATDTLSEPAHKSASRNT